MPETFDTVTQTLLDDIVKPDLSAEDKSTAAKTLKTIAEAEVLRRPESIPDPEPTGAKAFFKNHTGDLIKVGGSLSIVALIAVIEAKGDVIFRSKASKFIS